ncbi:MAG: Ig-like domain-containing protein [Bradymonadaceae bacterium]|nr:Ig-like domain-containing protein [Lujinxingiaceae bacterium]
MVSVKRVVGFGVLLACFLTLGCRPDDVKFGENGVSDATRRGQHMMDEGKSTVIELSDAASQGDAPAARPPVAKATALVKAQIDALYARLPTLAAEADDQSDFARRVGSKARPRTGDTVLTSFPPPGERELVEQVPSGPLEVLRFQPEGEVPAPPRLSVTFSQPMLAMTSHADSIKDGVPVRLTPSLEGNWRWIGTKTLIFEPSEAFPMATEYTVNVDAGTPSALGTRLASAFSASFATNPVELTNFYPEYGPQRLHPVIFLAFNQRVNAAEILEHITVTAGGRQHSIRLATPDEIQADAVVSMLADPLTARSWVAIRADEAFGTLKTVNVTLKSGAPSAEGPRRTSVDQSKAFDTHGPLELTGHRCGWGDECRPGQGWSLEFTNPIDESVDLSEIIKVNPPVADLTFSASDRYVSISGRTQGRTSYTVNINTGLKDTFGQRLSKARSVKFQVGSAHPYLGGAEKPIVILDPAGNKTYSIFSVNQKRVKVTGYRVTPQQWPEYVRYIHSNETGKMPGTKVIDTVVTPRGETDRLTETAIDLTPALGKDGLGHVVLEFIQDPNPHKWSEPTRVWIQSTQIGIDTFVDPTQMSVWASSLSDGRPLKDVEVVVGDTNVHAKTAANGMATVANDTWRLGGVLNYLIATRGSDSALHFEHSHYYLHLGQWNVPDSYDQVRWFVVDDRQMYKPGEQVRIKGWTRLLEKGVRGGVAMTAGARSVSYEVYESRGNSIAKGRAAVSEQGGFDLGFAIPDGTNLGHAHVRLKLDGVGVAGGEHQHPFQIQEFRRPEFEVKANSDGGPIFVGDEAAAWVTAAYYAGGALSETEVNWTVTHSPGHYTPPGRDDFVFGFWTPWWHYGHDSGEDTQYMHFSGMTDTAGEHRVQLAFKSLAKPRPLAVLAVASVIDVNRQAWEATTHLLVHPANEYVGLRSERLFVERGTPLEVEAIVADLEGALIVDREITMVSHRLKWTYSKGSWVEEAVDQQVCTVKSKGDAVRCAFQTPEGGQYRIMATVKDTSGRANQTQVMRWVSGGQQQPKRDIEEEEVTLIPDKQEYAIGDVAEILVQAPFYPSEGVVTFGREGIVKQERITLDGPSHTIRVPMEEGFLPNLFVQVDLNGATGRLNAKGELDAKLPKRPAFATGQLTLSMSKESRRLAVVVTPARAATEPGATSNIEVEVRDSAGKPVAGSEVLLFVVDEAVLALSNYTLADPLELFYAHRAMAVNTHKNRGFILLVDPRAIEAEAARELPKMEEDSMMLRSAPMPSAAPVEMAAEGGMDKGGGGGADAPIALRENFDALAAFEPTLRTDAAGKARISFKLPDNLTRYRVMAVAFSGPRHYGTGESQITARLPLMVRPSAPRFLNFGDQFEMPVVLQNQTNEPMQVQAAIRGTNVNFTESAGYMVTVPANDRVEVRFAATTVKAGRARFQVGASTTNGAQTWSDAAYFDLPIWTPATTEAFATYGTIDAGVVVQPVKMPDDVFAQFGGLELTTSSTELQALTDAFIYLSNYPFECSEQISSRILAVAALRDVLSAFEAEGMPSLAEIEAAMKRDIERLERLQNYDGGFGFWKRTESSWPYASLHVAHALRRAQQKGYSVPAAMMQRSEQYLENIERHIPSIYGEHARYALMAYALYVRNVGGNRDLAGAKNLFKRAGFDKLSLEAVGWLLSLFAQDAAVASEREAIRKHLNNRVQETAATAQFASDYGESNYLMLNTSRRTDGVILEALIAAEPANDLIPKLVRGLMGHRSKGQWGSTQDNVFVLLALDRYFNVFEKQTPNFVARAWLGEQFVGEHAFRGRTTERHHVDVPMAYLAKGGKAAQDFTIQKDGTGRMYYRLGMRYAPRSLKLEPADHGFAVERAYEPVDDDNDVKRRDDGSWEVRAGARVKVVLTMSVPARRYHVALVDPLPAGFEALNAALATTSLPPDDNANSASVGGRGGYWWWWGPWYEHQNMRDERVEAFTSLLWGGVYTYTYYARATTPGVFVAPPTKAEEMYHPETFGRSGSDRVIVK